MILSNIWDAIESLDKEIEKQENFVEQKGNEMALLGTEDTKPEADRMILSSYNNAMKIKTDKNSEIQSLTAKIKIWEDSLKKVRNSLSKKQNNTQVIRAEKLYTDMQAVADMFAETKERIFKTIVDKLQIVANNMYAKLTAGNQTLGGTLVFKREEDGTVKVKVVDRNGEELFGNGTGFLRMKQLAIVMSIISAKENENSFDYPFISDAPFSEFGVRFVNNFLDMAPHVFRQSIIMIKDLYDPDSKQYILPGGLEIAKRMRDGKLKGTFYVNYIEERADSSNLITKKMCYSE